MKLVELTLVPDKEDMEKMQEMAEKLFPHFNKANIHDDWHQASKSNVRNKILWIDKDDGSMQVNWFEFLIRWILPRVDKPMNTTWRCLIMDCKNPIEIVYEEFKRKGL